MVDVKIVRACINFEYFGLIDDDETDVSTQDQVSVCVNKRPWWHSNTLLKMDKFEQELRRNDVVNVKLDEKNKNKNFVWNSLVYSCKCISNF